MIGAAALQQRSEPSVLTSNWRADFVGSEGLKRQWVSRRAAVC